MSQFLISLLLSCIWAFLWSAFLLSFFVLYSVLGVAVRPALSFAAYLVLLSAAMIAVILSIAATVREERASQKDLKMNIK